eukprot:5322837-Pyramimonas_sp.AAC.1
MRAGCSRHNDCTATFEHVLGRACEPDHPQAIAHDLRLEVPRSVGALEALPVLGVEQPVHRGAMLLGPEPPSAPRSSGCGRDCGRQ